MKCIQYLTTARKYGFILGSAFKFIFKKAERSTFSIKKELAMTSKQELREMIRKGQYKALHAIRGRLFRDTSETLAYVEALSEFVGKKSSAATIELIMEVRSAFLGASREDIFRLFDRLCYDLDKCQKSLFVLLPAPTNALSSNSALQRFQRLLDVQEYQTSVTQDGNEKLSSGVVAILLFITISSHGRISDWFDVLHAMHDSNDVTALMRLFEMSSRLNLVAVRSVLFTEPDEEFQVINTEQQMCLPVPKNLINWFGRQQLAYDKKLKETNARLIAFTDRFREHAEQYRERFQDMWLDMMVRPKWALRSGDLDCVAIDIPELEWIKRIRFETISEFPNFRATFEERIYTAPSTHTTTCSPSDLYTKEFVEREFGLSEKEISIRWMNRALTYLAVRCVWEIVMGVRSKKNVRLNKEHGSNGAAVVRPQFRNLPDGQQASAEARVRALEVMKSAPLPGFTFVREYTRGLNPQSGNPLFTLTDIGLE